MVHYIFDLFFIASVWVSPSNISLLRFSHFCFDLSCTCLSSHVSGSLQFRGTSRLNLLCLLYQKSYLWASFPFAVSVHKMVTAMRISECSYYSFFGLIINLLRISRSTFSISVLLDTPIVVASYVDRASGIIFFPILSFDCKSSRQQYILFLSQLQLSRIVVWRNICYKTSKLQRQYC